jgi:hypothetical protein
MASRERVTNIGSLTGWWPEAAPAFSAVAAGSMQATNFENISRTIGRVQAA